MGNGLVVAFIQSSDNLINECRGQNTANQGFHADKNKFLYSLRINPNAVPPSFRMRELLER